MPPIISFAYTYEAVLADAKSETRRIWKRARVKAGMSVKAFDRLPCYGGRHIANLLITEVLIQNTSLMQDEDYFAEGLDYMENIKPGHRINIPPYGYTFDDFVKWRAMAMDVHVIRFKLIDIEVCHWRQTGQCYPTPYTCCNCEIWRE